MSEKLHKTPKETEEKTEWETAENTVRNWKKVGNWRKHSEEIKTKTEGETAKTKKNNWVINCRKKVRNWRKIRWVKNCYISLLTRWETEEKKTEWETAENTVRNEEKKLSEKLQKKQWETE